MASEAAWEVMDTLERFRYHGEESEQYLADAVDRGLSAMRRDTRCADIRALCSYCDQSEGWIPPHETHDGRYYHWDTESGDAVKEPCLAGPLWRLIAEGT